MGRLFSFEAEIARTRRDAFTEVMLPDSIGHDARNERIFAISEKTGERSAASGAVGSQGGNNWCRCRIQNGKKAGLNFLHRRLPCAAFEKVGFWRLVTE